MAFNNFLIDRERARQNTVLIIDEAQNLSPETMEQVRLLSNFETATTKLLQILLVGQPELKAKLDLPELRQLKQRVGLRCQIPPLTVEEARQYIRNRLRIAGARDLGIFTDSAIERMTEYSGGIPRVINILGDHCLLFGYADQTRKIDRSSVSEAIEYLEEGMPTQRKILSIGRVIPRRRSQWFVKTSVVALAVAVTGLVLSLDAGVGVVNIFESLRRAVMP
jgi:general secretion pathway protein A